jgi:hypothetical protein
MENKSDVFERWISGILFVMGSLGAGVDIMNIKIIIHIGESILYRKLQSHVFGL